MGSHSTVDTLENCAYPLSVGGYGWGLCNGIKRVESAVRRFLTTPIGSLLWAPTYGTRLHTLRTQGMTISDSGNAGSESTLAIVKADISKGFSAWLPDAQLEAINIVSDGDKQSLSVQVVWSARNPPRGVKSADQNKVVTTVVV